MGCSGGGVKIKGGVIFSVLYGNGRIVEDPNTCRTLWMVERCDVYVTMSSHSVVDEVRIQRAINSSMTGLQSIGKVVKSRYERL